MITRSNSSNMMFRSSLSLPLTTIMAVMMMTTMMTTMPVTSSNLALNNETAATTSSSRSTGAGAATTTASRSAAASSTTTRTITSSTHSNSNIFTPQEHASFRRDGYVVVRGNSDDVDHRMLNRQQLEHLVRAGESKIQTAPKFPFYYAVSTNGAIFEQESSSSSTTSTAVTDAFNVSSQHPALFAVQEQGDAVVQAFRDAALFSNIPRAVAELMQLDASTGQTLRVLRDIFIAKSVHDDSACDWHVDDVGFWPQSYLSDDHDSDENSDNNEKDQNGINVWIALDDMPAQYQGGMALAPGSHIAPWRHEAYLALGQNRSQDGGVTKRQVQQKMQERNRRLAQEQNNDEQANSNKATTTTSNNNNSKYPTCELGQLNPKLQQTIDATAVVLDIKRGDIILSTRNLFHKTVAVVIPGGVEYYKSQQKVEFLKRYSIRYVPGSARLPNGWSVEWSVVHNASNAGRRLDDIVVDVAAENYEQASDNNNSNINLMFYPRVWPLPQDNIHARLAKMAAAVEDLKARAQAEFISTFFATTE